MRVLDLFSGIGGFSLGLERAGMTTVAFCEIDPFCREVLRKHWPNAPIFDDVRTLTNEQTGSVDLVCGGFPCQPFSIAGHRKGHEDTRNMVQPMLEIVRASEPAWFVGENVEGFVDLGLDALCTALGSLGYATRVISLPACAVGLPSMERHLWIVATTSSERLERFWEIAVQAIEDGTKEFQGSDPRGSDRWDLPEARLCGVGERISRRVDRLRALGNAVDPHIPELLGRAIMQAHNAELTRGVKP